MVRLSVTTWLDRLENDLGVLVEIEPDLCVVLDEFGGILRVNPAFERTLGYTESEVLRHDIIRYVAIDDLAKFLHSFDYDTDYPILHLLKRERGYIPARLINYRFKEARGYLIFRPIDKRGN